MYTDVHGNAIAIPIRFHSAINECRRTRYSERLGIRARISGSAMAQLLLGSDDRLTYVSIDVHADRDTADLKSNISLIRIIKYKVKLRYNEISWHNVRFNRSCRRCEIFNLRNAAAAAAAAAVAAAARAILCVYTIANSGTVAIKENSYGLYRKRHRKRHRKQRYQI